MTTPAVQTPVDPITDAMGYLNSLAAGKERGGSEGGGSDDASDGDAEADASDGSGDGTDEAASDDKVKAGSEEGSQDDAEDADEKDAPKKPGRELGKNFRALKRQRSELAKREADLTAREADIRHNEHVVEQANSILRDLRQADDMQLLDAIARWRGTSGTELLRGLIAKMTGDAAPAAKDVESKLLKRLDELDKKIDDSVGKKQQEAANERLAAFTEAVTSALDPERHPLVSEYSEQDVVRSALSVARAYAQKTGKRASATEVLDFLETLEEQKVEKQSARLAAKKAPGRKDETGPSSGAGPGSRKAPSRAVTNGDAAERGNGRPPSKDERDLIADAESYLNSLSPKR